jgi:serine/threonine protein kinase
MGCAPSRSNWNAQYDEALVHTLGVGGLERRGSQEVMMRAITNEHADVDKEGLNIKKINGYEVKQSLGKGAFGEVFMGRKDSETYAIKVLRRSALKRKVTGKASSALDSVKLEIATMKKIAHPNCVHMFDVILDPTHDEIYLVLEFVDGGSSQKMDNQGRPIPLSERVVWSHMRHLVMGLEYLHMHQIVHRDIKPDNLLLTRDGSFGGAGMLKICDFGTSSLCEGDEGATKTVGTPPFFSPELCSRDSSGQYDNRVVDLWAVGVTMYLWLTGRMPFNAPTVMLLMEQIQQAEEVTPAPKEVSAGIGAVIEGLLTRDFERRLTLVQLRAHKWLTDGDRQVLPPQPVMLVEVTPEEIEQAFSNRAAMMAQSAAGPSHLGKAIGYVPNWKREGLAVIRKLCSAREAQIFRAIGSCGHLANHIPAIYGIKSNADDEADPEERTSFRRSITRQRTRPLAKVKAVAQVATLFRGPDGNSNPPVSPNAGHVESALATAEAAAEHLEEFEIRMQDLAAGMTVPCAMGILLGVRTVVADDFAPEAQADLQPERLDRMLEFDPSAVTEADKAAGGVSLLRYLTFLDEHASTAQLGFRIDASRTVVNGELADLPLPAGKYLETLKEESDVCKAFATFLQYDVALAKAFVVKLETLIAALQRSSFFSSHLMLRSGLLLFYDDKARIDKVCV